MQQYKQQPSMYSFIILHSKLISQWSKPYITVPAAEFYEHFMDLWWWLHLDWFSNLSAAALPPPSPK